MNDNATSATVTPTSKHRVRRTFASILGGLGVVWLIVGIVAFTLLGFVSSKDDAKTTLQELMAKKEIRVAIASELTKTIEEGDSNDVQDRVMREVVKKLRPQVETAIVSALNTPEVINFVGDTAALAYSVYVDEQPPANADMRVLANVAVNAIAGLDKRIDATKGAKMDPLEIKRDADAPDLKSTRDSLKSGVWSLLGFGLLAQVGAWFLSVANNWQRLRRLATRILIGSAVLVLLVSIIRTAVPDSVEDHPDAVRVGVEYITGPMMSWGIILLVLGIGGTVAGIVMNRRDPAR